MEDLTAGSKTILRCFLADNADNKPTPIVRYLHRAEFEHPGVNLCGVAVAGSATDIPADLKAIIRQQVHVVQ